MTSTFWPTTNSGATCNFPAELLQACGSFERFYNTRHSGRRLTWQPALGNADVKVAFKAKRHDLNVSTFALVILLLFEKLADDDFLTYEVSLRHPAQEFSTHMRSGHQKIYSHPRPRLTKTAANPRMREVQNSEETSTISRDIDRRFVFL
jgi:hypothetical protein